MVVTIELSNVVTVELHDYFTIVERTETDPMQHLQTPLQASEHVHRSKCNGLGPLSFAWAFWLPLTCCSNRHAWWQSPMLVEALVNLPFIMQGVTEPATSTALA